MDFDFWILNSGFYPFGFWISDFCFWILDFDFWILDFGYFGYFGFRIFWILDFSVVSYFIRTLLNVGQVMIPPGLLHDRLGTILTCHDTDHPSIVRQRRTRPRICQYQ